MATDDAAIFKRVGKHLPGGQHVRHLDAIGGRGESMLIRLEEVESDPFNQIPLLRSARRYSAFFTKSYSDLLAFSASTASTPPN